MAKGFNLTAQINLRGPTNLKPIVADIRRQLGSISADVNIKLNPQVAKSISTVTSRLKSMNDILVTARGNADALSSSLSGLSNSLSTISNSGSKGATSIARTGTNAKTAAQNIKQASTAMEEFGKQSYLAIKRFAAFSVVSGAIYKLVNAINTGFTAFVSFDKQLVKLQQVTGKGAIGLKNLENQITSLATTLGVSSESLIEVASTLAQAGLNAEDTRIALAALAKTELAPSFDSLTETTEGAIAALRQFELQAGDLEAALGSINAVAAAFAVESSDIITAIQRTGGVFAAASKGVSEGKDALNEFIAVFTSVRATTRESAETIATGLRTIFTRIQRGKTIEALKEYGVVLTDLEGKFVGPFEAVKRLSEGLSRLDPRDLRFSQIVEELGGFRQIGKVIPLIQQFSEAQKALRVAQTGQSSLTDAQVIAQKSLANQIAKVREQFLALIRDVGKSATFQAITKIVLNLTSAFISLAGAFKPILPFLAILGTIKGVKALGEFGTGFFGGLKKGGGASGTGQNLGESLSGAKEKQRAEATSRAADAIKLNTDALKTLTSAVQSLTSSIGSRGSVGLNSGGKVMAFARGGVVPGSGNRDTVPAMLQPGEFVIRKKAVETIGTGNLHRINKYASGGKVKDLTATKPDLKKYYDTEDDKDVYAGINIDRPTGETSFKQSREQYRERAEKIWQQASAIFSQNQDLQEANTYIRRKTRIDPGSYDAKELDPSNTAPQRLNRIQGALTEQTVRRQTTGLTKLPNAAGADFVYASSGGTQFIEVKNKLEKTEDSDLISKALLGYAYINSSSPKFFKNNQLDKISGLNIQLRSTNPLDIQSKNFGGVIQKFMAGGVVQDTEKSILERLIQDIKDIGGTTALYGFVSKPEIDQIIRSKSLPVRPQARSIVDAGWLRAKGDDRFGNRSQYIPALKDIVEAAKVKYDFKQKEKQDQIARNLQAASGGAYQFGLASIFGPKGEFGYNDVSNAKEIEGKDGTKYLTQIVQKSLPSRYESVIQKLKEDLTTAPQRAAENLQYADIFGTSGPLAFDFDETLVKGADIFGSDGKIDIKAYNDLQKVKDSLQNAELTALGKELQKRIKKYPQLLDSIRVLTARPQSNAPYLAATLSRLNLPIAESKITGVSGGLNKVNSLSDLETLIDDNSDNIESVLSGGKKAIQYQEARAVNLSDQSSRKSISVMEGYALEEMVRSLGVNVSEDDADPNRPIDFPNGLGAKARYWDLPSTIPTDTKRTNSSSAVNRLFEEAQRFYVEKFAFGGKVEGQNFEEVKKKILDKYPDIDFRISKRKKGRGFGYNLLGALKTDGGLLKSKGLQFQQPGNLQRLIEESDKMANSLLNPKKFALGGLADATSEMSGLMKGLYSKQGSQEQQAAKKEKQFGKIALRKDANSIAATYFKNDTRSGQVSAYKMRDYLYYVGLSQATQGYGPRLYDAVMEAATEQGAMLTSDRNSVSGAAKKVWEYYFKNRADVKKTPLKPDDWTRNQADIDPKLYGKPETWPPASDPAWILQSGYSKSPSLINDPGSVIRMDKQAQSSATTALQYFQSKPVGFAKGGSAEDTVPALLTPGEFVINKKAAKRIGYSRLHQMNRADKVQGYNSGGIVGGIQKFFVGGVAEKDAQRAQGQILSSVEEGAAAFAQIMSQLPKQLSDIILAKFKGIEDVEAGQAMSLIGGAPAFSEKTRGMAASSSKASSIGLQITGRKGGATTETVAHETGHLADFELGGGKGDFASEMKGTFQFELIAKIRKHMEDEFKKAGKSSEEINNYLGTGRELFAEFFAKASPEVRAIITSTTDAKSGMKALADSLGATGYTYAGLEASDLMPSKPKRPKKKDEFGFLKQQSKAIAAGAKTDGTSFEFLKPTTKTSKQAKQQLDDSGLKALTTGIAQTSGEIAKLKAQTESLYQQSKNLDNQISQYDQAILKIKSSTEEGAKGNKALNRLIQMKISAETQRLAVDKQAMASEEQLITLNQQKAQQIAAAKTFKATGGAGSGAIGATGPNLPVINTKTAQENAGYFARKAEKAGMSVSGYKYSLAQQVGEQAYNIRQDSQFAKAEAKDIAIGKSRELKGLNVKPGEFKSLLGEGATSDQAKKAQAAVAEFATNLQKIAPNMKPDEIRSAAEALAEGLATGTQSVEELIAGNEQLSQIFATTISEGEALDEAFRRVAEAAGISAETIKANVSPKAIEQQAFIKSKEGQRFGKLAEFAPGLTQKISQAGGERLGKAADFISGKGGKFSKGFAALGGFQGIGSGVAVGSEMLKTSGLIDKQTLKNPNVAGAFGAVQGAGVMGATGAELGGQLAGPIGALVGGIGGAVIGGIKGFFDAKNAQILSNALDKLTKSSEAVDVAFKELAKNDTDKNFKNVQKAFGQQIEAAQELENIAFGGGGEGPSVGGVGGGALAGAAGGALIGSFIPVIGTAIGAALGAVVGGGVAYLSEGQNKANREEALRNRVGSAGAMNESAARMAERQMGKMTTEQLGQQEKAGVNIIAEQYKESAIAAAEAANGTKNLTAAQKEQVSQGAAETAYLDAYMKMRKEAGATDEKISEDIMADRKLALEAGKKALDAQSQAAQKQALLARATKEVALATENLLDVYRRVGAKAQRFSDEVDDMLGGTQATIASLGGNATVQKVDRSGSERILGNMAAYSSQEVKAATQEMVGKLGGGEEAQALGKQAEAAKFLQDKLPSMLKAEGADPNQIIDTLSQQLGTMGIGGDAVDKMLGEIEKQISANKEGGLGTLADEISAGGIDKFSATAAEAAKTLQNLSKTYNDTLQKSIDLQNQYNEAVMQSNTYLRKAGSIRITAELDLAKALGNSPTLAQLNEPIDFEIKDLTKGLVAGGTTDPAAIAAGIVAKTEQNQQLQAANTNLGNVGMQGASGDAGARLLSEQQKNIAAMGANNVAINEGRQALERLANDGTKAANALAKIEEQQRQIEGLGNRFEKIFTASPEELFKMNRQSAALEAAKVAGPEQFKSRAFRQDAFAGLEQDKEFLTGEEYRKQRGMLMRKSLEAQGYTGQSMIQKGGISMTVDDFIKRIEGGVSEEDPNVKAYREAVDTQIKANEELARLEEIKSLQIQEAMLGLQVFLKNEFPKILTDAVKESKADSETKPETKTEASKGEKAKATAEKEKETAQKKREELDSKIATKERELSKEKRDEKAGVRGASVGVKVKKRELAELKAQRDAQVKAEEVATSKSKEADTTLAEEKKTREEAKAAQAAEEKKAKEAQVQSSIEQSQRAREGIVPTVIPAPPAPGTPEAELANIRQQRAEKEKRNEQTKIDEAKQTQTPTQQTQATTATYGAVKPQVQAVDKFTQGRLEAEKKVKLADVDTLTASKAAKEKEIKRKENALKAAKYAAAAAGTTETSPKLAAAQEAYDMAKADMASIDEQMKQAQDRIGIINQQLGATQTAGTTIPDRSNSQLANDEMRKAFNAANPQQYSIYGQQPSANEVNRGMQAITQPIATNLPKPVEYTRQVQAAETGATPNAGTKPTETTGQLITLDPTSLEGLNTFNTNFGSYVDKLVNFQFPTIPEKIEMTGTHVVDVRVSGAAAFESLQKGVKDLINKSIDEKMSEIWKQTGGAIGTRPGAPSPRGK